jgi:flagellar biosynthetic protein FliP
MVLLAIIGWSLLFAGAAGATTQRAATHATTAAGTQTVPPITTPTDQTTTTNGNVSVNLDLGSLGKDSDPSASGKTRKPDNSVVILLLLSVLAIAPSLVIMMTSFTRMIVVLSLVRNAVGLQTIPPNQVITGLALFLSLFVMAPTLKQVNDQALQPYLHGDMKQSQAFKVAQIPIKHFMLANTRSDELNLMIQAGGKKAPAKLENLSLVTVIPAFVLSELKSAFIIGVMVLLPFLVIDLVVASGLMSLGMMMLPPVFVSLPFKLLLFVMVDGWAMVAHALLANYH